MNAAGHDFVRPGQVSPDLPPPDNCMRCGLPVRDHQPRPEPAEAIAGRALLADFQHEAHEFTTGTRAAVDWTAYALRLGQHLQALLDALSRAEPTGGAWLAPGDVYRVVCALREAAEHTDPATAAAYRQLVSQLDGGGA